MLFAHLVYKGFDGGVLVVVLVDFDEGLRVDPSPGHLAHFGPEHVRRPQGRVVGGWRAAVRVFGLVADHAHHGGRILWKEVGDVLLLVEFLVPDPETAHGHFFAYVVDDEGGVGVCFRGHSVGDRFQLVPDDVVDWIVDDHLRELRIVGLEGA